MTRATVEGLRSLVRPEEVAQLRGKTIAEVLPIPKAAPETASESESQADAEAVATAEPVAQEAEVSEAPAEEEPA
jgi:small subunit ribosomal protein S5